MNVYALERRCGRLKRRAVLLWRRVRSQASWGMTGNRIIFTQIWLPNILARARWWIARRRLDWRRLTQ